jgi:hypothetical protein
MGGGGGGRQLLKQITLAAPPDHVSDTAITK